MKINNPRFVSRLAAKRRGWEGPYRYRYQFPYERPPNAKADWCPNESTALYGWIAKRGTKWLHFITGSGERFRVPLSEERYMLTDQHIRAWVAQREAELAAKAAADLQEAS